jgi:hypothetical protein
MFREKRNAWKVLVDRAEEKRPLEGWEDNIKIVFKKITLCNMDCLQTETNWGLF